MYSGELQIFKEDLDIFLNVAQRFKLEGLISDPDMFKSFELTLDADQEEELNIKETNPFNNENLTFQDGFTNLSSRTKSKLEGQETKVSTDIKAANISEVEEQIKQNIVKNLDGTYSCQICGKNSGRNIYNCRNHIETHLEGLSFNCPMCEKTFRSRNSLAMHKSTKHRNNTK